MKTVIYILLVLIAANLYGQSDLRGRHYNLKSGVALEGYDPVCYFQQGKALKGKKEFSSTSNNVTYYFSTSANKSLFEKEPQKYEPQYGGWCAYAMGASGEKVQVDPETFKISGGKLYLFYNRFFNNTLPKWNEDENNLRSKADNNWTNVFK